MEVLLKKRSQDMVLLKPICFVCLFFLFNLITLQAQSNSYILYLKNKQGTTGSINDPSTYLSPRSIERKNKQNILIDSLDLPVSQSYLDQINMQGAEIVFTSKWMNAVCIKATSSQYNAILNLPFVNTSVSTFRISTKKNTQATSIVAQPNYATYFSDYIGITQMHQMGINGKGVLIAITDSGFPGTDTLSAFKHLWSNNQIDYYYDVADKESNIFNDDNHGTYILSVLAAQATDYTGIVPAANYILLRTEVAATESTLEEYNWLRAAEIADSCGADIISVSLGYTTFDNPATSYTYADMNGKTSIISQAADMAYDKGIIVVCSAGNDGNTSWKYIGTPADAKNVLAVGSVDMNNSKSAFSSVGPTADGRIKPDLCAPGSNIYCIKPDGTLFIANGTSLSTPMISGLIAGMKESYPALTNDALKSLLLQSCDQYQQPDDQKGYGVPHFTKTYKLAGIYTDNATSVIAPNPYQSGELFLKVPVNNELYNIEVFDNQGKLNVSYSEYTTSTIIEMDDLVKELTPGFYLIVVQSANNREILKWIKL
jgi:serine protease AprX